MQIEDKTKLIKLQDTSLNIWAGLTVYWKQLDFMYLLGIKRRNIFSADTEKEINIYNKRKRNGKDLMAAKGCWLLSHQFPRAVCVNIKPVPLMLSTWGSAHLGERSGCFPVQSLKQRAVIGVKGIDDWSNQPFSPENFKNDSFLTGSSPHTPFMSQIYNPTLSVLSAVQRGQKTVLPRKGSDERVCKVLWRAGRRWQTQGNEGLPHIYKGSQAHQSFAIKTPSQTYKSLDILLWSCFSQVW